MKAGFVPVAIHQRQPYVSVVRIASSVAIFNALSRKLRQAPFRSRGRARNEGCGGAERWSRLGSNQRPPACEAGALPLSYETGAERRTRSKISTRRRWVRKRRGTPYPNTGSGTKRFVRSRSLDYRRASHRTTISSVACGCSAVGSASPCQGEGRGFESRHPLEVQVASTPAVEWPSGEATACKAVHTGSIPVSTSNSSYRARLAQRESASLTRKRSLVQSQYRAPQLPPRP